MQKRLLRIKEVIALTGLSRSYIYKLTDEGGFPPKVNLTAGGTSVAWVEAEVQAWIEQKISNRNLGQS